MLKLKTITDAQKKQVEDRVRECFNKFFPGYNFSCYIYYRNDLGAVAGYAYSDDRHIELNETLLVENFEDFLATTIPHEVAHLLTKQFYPDAKQAHGKEFREVCKKLGFPEAGKTYHSYDLSSVVEKKQKTLYVYECIHGCMTFKLSSVIHKRISQEGQIRCCGECRTVLQYTHQTVTY
jgi:SprT protein